MSNRIVHALDGQVNGAAFSKFPHLSDYAEPEHDLAIDKIISDVERTEWDRLCRSVESDLAVRNIGRPLREEQAEIDIADVYLSATHTAGGRALAVYAVEDGQSHIIKLMVDAYAIDGAGDERPLDAHERELVIDWIDQRVQKIAAGERTSDKFFTSAPIWRAEHIWIARPVGSIGGGR